MSSLAVPRRLPEVSKRQGKATSLASRRSIFFVAALVATGLGSFTLTYLRNQHIVLPQTRSLQQPLAGGRREGSGPSGGGHVESPELAGTSGALALASQRGETIQTGGHTAHFGDAVSTAVIPPAASKAPRGRWAVYTADQAKQDAVRDAMRHAWGGYAKHALGFDEVDPVSNSGVNKFGGLGATVMDSLDTLYIMGLSDEFAVARDWIATRFNPMSSTDHLNVFETTIRFLGGLIAAYDLSGDKVFLDKAVALGDRLAHVFSTRSGLAWSWCHLGSLHCETPRWISGVYLAEFGSMQLEFAALSRATGNETYNDLAERALKVVFDSPHRPGGKAAGLFQTQWSLDSGTPTSDRVGTGGASDSFYEYLLKVWVLGGRTPELQDYRTRWEQAMTAMSEMLVQTTPKGLTYVADAHSTNWKTWTLNHAMEHLSCFVGGMLVLGMDGGAADAGRLKLARSLSDTCVEMYSQMATGLSADTVEFDLGTIRVVDGKNILRPEAVETLFYLFRKTGERKYRDQGWRIFLAFEQHCKASGGYSGLRDVRQANPTKDGEQQSFFLAETLKYLYLLFSNSSTVDLDEWTFNTEAHPFRVTQRTHTIFAPTAPGTGGSPPYLTDGKSGAGRVNTGNGGAAGSMPDAPGDAAAASGVLTAGGAVQGRVTAEVTTGGGEAKADGITRRTRRNIAGAQRSSRGLLRAEHTGVAARKQQQGRRRPQEEMKKQQQAAAAGGSWRRGSRRQQ